MPATLDFSLPANQPFQVLTAPSNAWVTVALPKNEVVIKHSGRQGGAAGLESDTADVLFIKQGDVAGGAPDYADGAQIILNSGERLIMRGADARPTANGTNVIQLRAASNSVAVWLLSGGLDLSGK